MLLENLIGDLVRNAHNNAVEQLSLRHCSYANVLAGTEREAIMRSVALLTLYPPNTPRIVTCEAGSIVWSEVFDKDFWL